MSDFAPVAMRPKTFLEKQPYMAAYCVAISIPSPVTIIYQLGKLNRLSLPPSTMIKLSMQILPHQTLLKLTQMNISTPVKEYLNPWAAFAVVGVIQGGVYGQANVHFAKALQIGKNPELKGMFRGVLFAGGRDVISQGIPFMCSKYVKKYLFDPIVPSNMEAVSLWGSILSTSIVSTYLSQGFQNCQITMQANQDLSYLGVVKRVWQQNGFTSFYKGAEARVGLLLIVNILNELLLKKAWEQVPIEEH